MQPPPVFAVRSPGSGTGAVGEEQSQEIRAAAVPGLSGVRGACALAFPSPNPQGAAIRTHHPDCQSDQHLGQRPPSDWTCPFSPSLSSGAVGSASPAGASQWRADEQRVLRTTPQPGLLAGCGHSSGTPPAGGHWEKLARLQVWPLTRGSSRRQFLELFTEDLPGPRSRVHHCPSNRRSIIQSNN